MDFTALIDAVLLFIGGPGLAFFRAVLDLFGGLFGGTA